MPSLGLIPASGMDSIVDNPYVSEAQSMIMVHEGEFCVFARLLFSVEDQLLEDPVFLRDPELRLTVKRVAGSNEGTKRGVLYHCTDEKQARKLLDALLEGRAYEVENLPVQFHYTDFPDAAMESEFLALFESYSSRRSYTGFKDFIER